MNLLNTLKQPGVNDIISFTFYPVGGFTNPGINKSVSCPSSDNVNFDLPDKNCEGDKFEACLMNVTGCTDYTCSGAQQLGLSTFLDCFEGLDGSSMSDADNCAQAAGFSAEKIHGCYDDSKYKNSVWDALQSHTKTERPTLTCFPWVEVDGAVLTDNCFGPHARTYPLLDAICNHAKAAGIPEPVACAHKSTIVV